MQALETGDAAIIDDILSQIKVADVKGISFPPAMLIGLSAYLLNTIEVVGHLQ